MLKQIQQIFTVRGGQYQTRLNIWTHGRNDTGLDSADSSNCSNDVSQLIIIQEYGLGDIIFYGVGDQKSIIRQC